jgi:hypothetical protein
MCHLLCNPEYSEKRADFRRNNPQTFRFRKQTGTETQSLHLVLLLA